MKTDKKLHSVFLASAALILFLILISSTVSAATVQSASTTTPCAYITNRYSNSVSVIDTATNTVKATVDVGSNPFGVAVNPARTKAYVTNLYEENYDSALSEQIATKSALSTKTEEHIATGEGTVSVIDIATNTVTATVPVGIIPEGVAVNPAGTKVYVTNLGSNTVSVIDAATNTITATVSVGSGPLGVTVSPDGTKAYVVNEYDSTVSVIDTATNTVTATVSVGDDPSGVAITPDGKKVYVTNYDTVSVIDTATNTVTDTVTVEILPWEVAVNPSGTKVYVTNFGSDTVSVIDTATNTVTATVPVGSSPIGIAFIPDGTKVYVANSGSYTVSEIDTATNTVTSTVDVGSSPVAFGQFIATLSPGPFANFSAKPTEGKAPLNVKFTDTSTGTPTKWKWDFGDGTTSTKQNPTHKYSKVGSYTVKLTATNAKGSNTLTKTDYVNVVTKPVAAFSASPTSGKAPLTVEFTDKSTGIPTRWKWSFGDGKTSTQQNPEHQYSQEGKYKVTLTVSNVAGGNTVTKTNYITVTTNTRPGTYSESK